MVRDWNGVKGTLYHLYVKQGQSLQHVTDVMKTQYNFVASERAYKHKIHEWHWRTNRGADNRIATIRRRRRRQTIITNGDEISISHGGGASIATARDTNFRALDPRVLSGRARSPDPSTPWSTPGSFNLDDVGQDHSPDNLEVGHGFEVLQQNTSPRFESDILDQQDSSGRTSLHRMVAIGELDNVKDIVSRGARIDIPDNEGNQPLHLAATKNYSHIIRYLLKSGAKVNAKGVNGRTPLHLALGLAQALRALLGAHPNLLTPDNNGDTALHAAVRKFPKKRLSNGGVIEKLLSNGANVNTINHAGVTPFHIAMEQISYIPYDSYVPCFLEHDADIHLKTNSGEWPFAIFLKHAWAYRSIWWREILIFLRKGADPNTQVLTEDRLLYVMLKTGSWTPDSGPRDIVLQLCKTANIYIPSAEGDLPLHCVMKSSVSEYYTNFERYLEIVEALLHRGADPNQANEKGERPLHILLSSSLYCPSIKSVLTNLLDNGADPMLVDSSGYLPVYIPYRRVKNIVRVEIVRILTEAFIARPENSDGGNNSQSDTFWWRKYRAFRLQHQWSDEATQLLQAASNRATVMMPQDVSGHLPKLLLSFAAEAKLQAAKSRFSSDDIGWNPILESSHVVRILRDCKNSGIDVDVSWYHFLLEILP